MHPSNIRGVLHSVRPDRCVIHARTYVHILHWEDIAPSELERMHERIGQPVSLWCHNVNGTLVQAKPSSFGDTAPYEAGYVRRRGK